MRDSIINLLSRSPQTLTELSAKLSVSKASVSYHLAALQSREIVEVADVKIGRGGVESKKFRIHAGSLVTTSRLKDEEDQLRRLAELFEVTKLSWTVPEKRISGLDVEIFLYQMFSIIYNVTRSDHKYLFEQYGYRFGDEVVSKEIRGRSIREMVGNLAAYLRDSGMVKSTLLTVPNSTTVAVLCSKCFGNYDHRGPVCSFTEGTMKGVVSSKFGSSFNVSRLHSDLPFCVSLVGRESTKDQSWLKAALVRTPRMDYAGE